MHWIPASAGMTIQGFFLTSKSACALRKRRSERYSPVDSRFFPTAHYALLIKGYMATVHVRIIPEGLDSFDDFHGLPKDFGHLRILHSDFKASPVLLALPAVVLRKLVVSRLRA